MLVILIIFVATAVVLFVSNWLFGTDKSDNGSLAVLLLMPATAPHAFVTAQSGARRSECGKARAARPFGGTRVEQVEHGTADPCSVLRRSES
jgi:hypothetical protein